MSRFGQLVLVAAAATLATVLVRVLAGEPLGSDAYSHLVWARDAVRHGTTGHSPFDYTVPKPFAQGVAALGTKLGAATFVVEWTSLAGAFACAAAAAALARRVGTYPAAPLAALFALCLPVLWRGGPLGDSNVTYAALVVAAAASGMGTRACAVSLGLAGTLRPEAWGLAIINAVLGWRTAALAGAHPRDRRGGRPAGALDQPRQRVHGRLVVVEQHRRRLQRALPAAAARPRGTPGRDLRARRRRLDLAGRAARGRRARGRASRRRPFDAAIVFPVALILALLTVVVRGQISADDVGRMLTALAVFAAAGAAVALAEHNSGAVRGSLAIVAVAAVPIAAAPWLAGAVRDVRDQGREARSLEQVVAPALEREQPAGYIALPRQWQGQLALAWDRPRSSFIPARAIGEGNEIDKCEVGALIVPADGKLPKWIRQVVLTHDWRAGRACQALRQVTGGGAAEIDQ